jgi:hypothetical protein
LNSKFADVAILDRQKDYEKLIPNACETFVRGFVTGSSQGLSDPTLKGSLDQDSWRYRMLPE